MSDVGNTSGQRGLFDPIDSDQERDNSVNDENDSNSEGIQERKDRLSREVATRQFDTLEARVAYILAQFPETRNSDITLQIQYWTIFNQEKVAGGMVPLKELYSLERLTSIARARATIQNTYQLYQATADEVAKRRQQLREEEREKHKPIETNIRPLTVFADESGKNQPNLVVGSVWILAATEEYRLYREMTDWVERTAFKQELKFNGVSKSNQDRYREFIERFMVREGALGFKAISMSRVGLPDEAAALADLYHFLIRRGIEHEHDTGRAVLPRRISFVKDAEEAGYDDRLLALLTDRIQQASQNVFGGDVILEYAGAEDSKAYVFLQIADLFTGCVNRVMNRPSQITNWKDEFAEDVLALLGVDLEDDETEMLNDRAVRLSLRSPTLRTRPEP